MENKKVNFEELCHIDKARSHLSKRNFLVGGEDEVTFSLPTVSLVKGYKPLEILSSYDEIKDREETREDYEEYIQHSYLNSLDFAIGLLSKFLMLYDFKSEFEEFFLANQEKLIFEPLKKITEGLKKGVICDWVFSLETSQFKNNNFIYIALNIGTENIVVFDGIFENKKGE